MQVIKESIPQRARAVSITAISLIGLTVMAGVVGAGGLGDFAVMRRLLHIMAELFLL